MSFPLRSILALLLAAQAMGEEPKTDSYPNEILKDEPVVYFRFLDPQERNQTDLASASNSKNKGTDGVAVRPLKSLPGPHPIGGRAASFEGTDYFEIPHHPDFDSADFSVEFWFRSRQSFDKTFWPGSATLVTKATPGPGSADWTILGGSLQNGLNEGRILVGIGPKGGQDTVLASEPGLNDGLFHHIVWTRNGRGQNHLFVDGTPCATAEDGGGLITNRRAIQVGGEKKEPGGTFFKGEIAELAIYGHTLPGSRVQSHYAKGITDPRLPMPAQGTVDFVRDIRPIFQKHCHSCHGLTREKGGFALINRTRALEGGDTGKGIIPGKSEISLLVSLISGLEEDRVMPPSGKRLSREEIGLIRAWIDSGVSWPENANEVDPKNSKKTNHWSFQPLVRPPVPVTKPSDWARNPIDAFIQEKHRQNGLAPAPAASRETWLRRVTIDLTGLPPTVEEIKVFTGDNQADAHSKVVDRLLDSTAYGERWARHWLDVVRYADSGGFETDIFYEQAWRYRDYVIRSLNEDKPYDRFLLEQVAGDEIWPEKAEAMQDAIAVWTLGEWQNALDDFPQELEYVRRTDMVTTFGEGMLGLSVGCANCHNHKYDPITQRDYFGLEAIFAASETRDKKTGQKLWVKGQRASHRILVHNPKPTPIRLLTRGELGKPKGIVSPALPTFLPGGGPLPDVKDENKHRRARLARWLVSPQNPLTARVMANRVWQWHFGQGLSQTPNDFGTQGLPPSHPELLDWLACELKESDWSLKKLHRMIVLSTTYGQSTVPEPKAMLTDPKNIWLAGFPRKRLEAEAIWDQLHASAGILDKKSFGPPFVPPLSLEELQGIYDIENKPENKWKVTAEQNRRGIYILSRRSFRFPLFDVFDPPNNGTSCPVRQTTHAPTQALTLMNNATVSKMAKAMADRLVRQAGTDKTSCIRLAWILAFSREPDESELKNSLDFLSRSEAAHAKRKTPDFQMKALFELCLGIMNATEFIYTN